MSLVKPLNNVEMWAGFIALQLKVIAPWLPRNDVKVLGEIGSIFHDGSRINQCRWRNLDLFSAPSRLRDKYAPCSNWVSDSTTESHCAFLVLAFKIWDAQFLNEINLQWKKCSLRVQKNSVVMQFKNPFKLSLSLHCSNWQLFML